MEERTERMEKRKKPTGKYYDDGISERKYEKKRNKKKKQRNCVAAAESVRILNEEYKEKNEKRKKSKIKSGNAVEETEKEKLWFLDKTEVSLGNYHCLH